MRIFVPGNDSGSAVFAALVLVMVLSAIFIALVFRINAVKRYVHEYKAEVIRSIEKTNRETADRYELY